MSTAKRGREHADADAAAWSPAKQRRIELACEVKAFRFLDPDTFAESTSHDDEALPELEQLMAVRLRTLQEPITKRFVKPEFLQQALASDANEPEWLFHRQPQGFTFDPVVNLRSTDPIRCAVRAITHRPIDLSAPLRSLGKLSQPASVEDVVGVLWPAADVVGSTALETRVLLAVLALLAWLCTVSPAVLHLLGLAPKTPGNEFHVVNLVFSLFKYLGHTTWLTPPSELELAARRLMMTRALNAAVRFGATHVPTEAQLGTEAAAAAEAPRPAKSLRSLFEFWVTPVFESLTPWANRKPLQLEAAWFCWSGAAAGDDSLAHDPMHLGRQWNVDLSHVLEIAPDETDPIHVMVEAAELEATDRQYALEPPPPSGAADFPLAPTMAGSTCPDGHTYRLYQARYAHPDPLICFRAATASGIPPACITSAFSLSEYWQPPGADGTRFTTEPVRHLIEFVLVALVKADEDNDNLALELYRPGHDWMEEEEEEDGSHDEAQAAAPILMAIYARLDASFANGRYTPEQIAALFEAVGTFKRVLEEEGGKEAAEEEDPRELESMEDGDS